MPHELSMWVLACFDPMRSELVIPRRGMIRVDGASFQRVFGLLNEGRRARFEMDTQAIAFMNKEYDVEGGMAPTFTEWCNKIKDMKGVADLKFLQAYIAGVLSYFICPNTKCNIYPRCYGAIMNLEEARCTNFAQLAIDQIIAEVKTMGSKKNSVCCCLYHLVVSNFFLVFAMCRLFFMYLHLSNSSFHVYVFSKNHADCLLGFP